MGLTFNQFQVIRALSDRPGATQREIAEAAGLGLATVNSAYKECTSQGLIDEGRLAAKGMAELKPYAVDNAVILAAGLSSRFAPISYERPKGLLRVRGEVLIERQIEQLHAAGVRDIVVVVGYKKEAFFYLEDKYGVRIVVNRDYAERNNSSSMMLVREILGNTYICSSDNYFEENPFESHVWKAYYAAQLFEGPTDEWALTTGSHGRIAKVEVGGSDAWCMVGHAYFDRAFSERFREILEAEYDLPETRSKLWEDLYAEHVRELDMRIRRYDPPIIHEFDSLDELRAFDPLFLENLDSRIFDNIVAVLGCAKSEIRDVYPLKQGLTNLSCHFATDDGEWVYRHPGAGTELIIDREAEVEGLETARLLGLDPTFVFENPKRGWKISRFVPNARNLDAHVDSELKVAMGYAHRLHESGATVKRSFSFYDEGKGYERKALERGPIDAADYWEMSEQAGELNGLLLADGSNPVLCHNDFFGLNFLVAEDGGVSLIDWEYAGMGDYANDFGTFAVCEQLSEEEMRRALAHYFGREPTADEWRHNLGQVGMAGWCWYAWSLLKIAEGDDPGEWTYIYYRAGKTYLRKALGLYRAAGK
ncbi:NTP transferase domain-containing protein [Collinsella tanakaei]|uniref:NTP transferase domain-containing protein n=1 Tax=Collinsella ihumii TaxID=1720204 RepID=UPI00195A85E7|nr:NTP transferase domain-containing protein [Collinsella ihumii]MBM6689127.1 NTP transferase domain-containing protein [Collinsella tanakaei]MDN0055781.1 NTP transferase domain-containing protein [Collinsella ihumii]